MGAVLLDTTVLIDLLRGRGAAGRLRGLRASGDMPFVCAINVEEIVRGLRPGEEPPARKLVEGLRLAPLGDIEGWRAGEWRRDFAARGVTLAAVRLPDRGCRGLDRRTARDREPEALPHAGSHRRALAVVGGPISANR